MERMNMQVWSLFLRAVLYWVLGYMLKSSDPHPDKWLGEIGLSIVVMFDVLAFWKYQAEKKSYKVKDAQNGIERLYNKITTHENLNRLRNFKFIAEEGFPNPGYYELNSLSQNSEAIETLNTGGASDISEDLKEFADLYEIAKEDLPNRY